MRVFRLNAKKNHGFHYFSFLKVDFLKNRTRVIHANKLFLGAQLGSVAPSAAAWAAGWPRGPSSRTTRRRRGGPAPAPPPRPSASDTLPGPFPSLCSQWPIAIPTQAAKPSRGRRAFHSQTPRLPLPPSALLRDAFFTFPYVSKVGQCKGSLYYLFPPWFISSLVSF